MTVTVSGDTQAQVTCAIRLIERVTAGNGFPDAAAVAAAGAPGKVRDRHAERGRMRAAAEAGSKALKVAVDCGMWKDAMSTKELRKLANQIRRLYGVNMVQASPAHVHLTAFETGSELHKCCIRYCEGFENYVITKEAARRSKILLSNQESARGH